MPGKIEASRRVEAVKAISAIFGVMMLAAIYTPTKLAVPLYVNGDW